MKKNAKIRIATGMMAACLLCGNAFALDTAVQQNADETVAVTAQVSEGTAQQEQNVAAKKTGYATASVNVRSKPSNEGEILGTLSKGTSVEILGSEGNWYQISFAGKTGYVYNKYISLTKPEETPKPSTTKTVYTTADLNVREQPNNTAKILGTLKKGAEVQTTALTNGWYTISFAGKTGYISASYTTTTKPSTPAKPSTDTDMEFTDVPKTAWYYQAVNWAVTKGITAGTSKTTFSPNQVCTRAQAVMFLWKNAGSPDVTKSVANPFTDVKTSNWYYKAVMWAVNKGITSGTTKTTFSPNKTCSRAEIVTFMWKANGSKKVAYKNPFTDVKIADWYYEPVMWAVKNEITAGTSKTTFAPKNGCTRAQVVTFLYNAD